MTPFAFIIMILLWIAPCIGIVTSVDQYTKLRFGTWGLIWRTALYVIYLILIYALAMT